MLDPIVYLGVPTKKGGINTKDMELHFFQEDTMPTGQFRLHNLQENI